MLVRLVRSLSATSIKCPSHKGFRPFRRSLSGLSAVTTDKPPKNSTISMFVTYQTCQPLRGRRATDKPRPIVGASRKLKLKSDIHPVEGNYFTEVVV
jgi:hypothetical protein